MATLIDTNVLLDVFDIGSSFEQWALKQLATCRRAGPLVINPIVYAEMGAGFASEEALDAALPASRFEREDLPWNAAYLAGQAFLSYRRSGGGKRAPLPDFYIGAHAVVRNHVLLTRDARRYRSYFPTVELITPETHP